MRRIRRPCLAGAAALGALLAIVAGVPVAGATRQAHRAGVLATTSGLTTKGITARECAANRAAGPITFETSFSYAAAASILDVVVAKDRGYLKDMCLDVTLESGFSTTNVADVSSNHVQISSLGSNSEVIAANLEGANVVGIATLGNTAITELITPPSLHIRSLKQLDNKTIGIKGAIPYEVAAMLRQQGVNLESLRQVQVGYDPTIIDNGSVDALPVYKSNEIYELRSKGIKVTVWDPTAFHISSSFASFVANRSWAHRHPTAVTDFLRADLHAFSWSYTHQAQAVSYTQALLPPYLGITPALSRFRWRVESAVCVTYAQKGAPFGAVNLSAARYEYAQDRRLGLLAPGSSLNSDFTNSYLDAAYRGTTLVWPKKLG